MPDPKLIMLGLVAYGLYYAYTEGWLEKLRPSPDASKANGNNRAAYAQQVLAVDQHLTAEGVSLEDRQAKLTPLVPYMLQPGQPVQQMPACRFPAEGSQ